MLRIHRRLRGLLLTAVATGAMLVLPGVANALPVSATVTKDASTPSIEPGAVVKYNVVIDVTGAAVAADGVITISANQSGSVAGGTVGTTPGANDTLVTIAAGATPGTRDITVKNGFATGDPVTVSFDVTLPPSRRLISNGAGFKVNAFSTDVNLTATSINSNSAQIDIYKGDGTKTSKLYERWGTFSSTPAGLGDWWAPKDSTVTYTVTINNWGDGSAYNVDVFADAFGDTSPLFEEPLKAGSETDLDFFSPTAKVVAGGDCVIVALTDDGECIISEIPAGGSKTVTLSITKLNFIDGRVTPDISFDNSAAFEKSRQFSSPGFNDTDNFTGGRGAAAVELTDGGTVSISSQAKGPRVFAGKTDQEVKFEFANAGGNDVTGGKLRLTASKFNDKGASIFGTWHVGDANAPAEPFKSATLSNGGTCAAATELVWTGVKYERKTLIGVFDCTGVSIPKGGRVIATIVVNFASSRKDSSTVCAPVCEGDGESAGVSGTLYTPQFEAPGSSTSTSWSASLNRAATTDLEVSVTSAAQIGAERLGLHVVTIKNNGPIVAKNVSLSGSLYRDGGLFEPSMLPGSCAAVIVPTSLACNLGDLAVGQSTSVTIPVLGPKKVGSTLVATYTADNWETESNWDNNSVAQAQDVVKAALAPLQGVVVVKAPAVVKLGTLGRTGLPTKVTVPGPAVIVVDLQISRAVALKLGLIKGRAKAPAFIKIGTGTKKVSAAGKVTVVTKLNRLYKAKVLKLRKPLAVQRVVKVTSTAPLTRGATSTTTSNFTLRR